MGIEARETCQVSAVLTAGTFFPASSARTSTMLSTNAQPAERRRRTTGSAAGSMRSAAIEADAAVISACFSLSARIEAVLAASRIRRSLFTTLSRFSRSLPFPASRYSLS